MKRPATTALRSLVEKAVVLAYREDTSQLEAALSGEGFAQVVVQRAHYTEPEMAYARNFRCFMNHREAWQEAAGRPGWTMIMEADFVPCAGIGGMPAPVPEAGNPGLKWAFLYTSSPRVFWEEPGGFLRGYQATAVCYLIHGAVAARLLEFWEEEIRLYGVGSYFTFDSHLCWRLIGKGCEAYFPARSFGEHGGLPNREHREAGGLPNAGRHRADVLAAPLAFAPAYAPRMGARFRLVRAGARLRALARLVAGRWVLGVEVRGPRPVRRARLYWLGILRQLSL